MKLIIPVLMNIFLAIGIYLMKKDGKLKNVSYIKSQILIGFCFGLVSMFSSSFGVELAGVVVNVRDAAPITAGLLFGPWSGVIAGVMGGAYRAFSVLWGAGTYTALACTISTIVAGIVAAILRQFVFDNKRPTVSYAVGITVVLEVFHMLMIFITNFRDAHTAFTFVRQCTWIMVLANSLAVGLAVFFLSLLNKEFKLKRENKEKGIADTFQVWLLASILIAFLATSLFTYNLQTSINNKNIQETFEVTMTDTGKDIIEASDSNFLEILFMVRDRYLANPDVTLSDLLVTKDYVIKEINIINKEGFIERSTDISNVGFDMRSSTQSSEFLILRNKPAGHTFVQEYGLNGKRIYRKYAGVSLEDGGFLQIGYDSYQFHSELNQFVIDATKNRHVGVNGFIAVCDEQLDIVINNEYSGLPISTIGIEPNKEMLNKKDATKVYTAEIVNKDTDYKEKYIYVFAFAEGYCIIAAMPMEEAMLMRNASMYLSIFMQTLIFAVLFALIFYLIKKIIVNNLHKINHDLAEITGGNLEVLVDVRTSEEFSSLSDDINTTVSTLKRYIAEAAARIDKELEYAKQIQLSALPTNYIDNDELGINAAMIAAKEVGGDFYDFYKLDDNTLVILVADVSGKGIPAAMFMMTAKTIIKDLAESGLEVNEILQRANDKLCENNESGMFVTAWIGILDIESGVLKYANAGHNPPVVLLESGEFEYLKSRPGFILGGMEGIKYTKNEFTLTRGNRVFLYTDGVTEATNLTEELYGDDRLVDFMNNNKTTPINEVLPSLKGDIDLFVGDAPQFDDITMLMLEYRKKTFTTTQVFKAEDADLTKVLTLFETELEKYECSLKNTTAICVAIEEIFINICHYAYEEENGECQITLNFNEASRELTIEMVDQGIPFNPLVKQDPDVTLSAEERKIGGLGIYIMKKTMDNVTYRYENDSNILTMKKVI